MMNKFLYGEDNSPAITDLLGYGIDVEVVNKLIDLELRTCLCILSLTNKDLAAVTGLSEEAKLDQIQKIALNLCMASGSLGKISGAPKDKARGGEVLNVDEVFVVAVKNLPRETSIVQIQDHFKAAGEPTRIVLSEDFKNNNVSAHIYYDSKSSADKALIFHRSFIGEWEILVKSARADMRKSSSSSGQSSSSGPIHRLKDQRGSGHPY